MKAGKTKVMKQYQVHGKLFWNYHEATAWRDCFNPCAEVDEVP